MKRIAYVSTLALALASSASAAPPKVGGPYKAAVCDVIEVEIEADKGGEIGFHNPYDVTTIFIRDAVPRRQGTVAFIIQPKEKAVFRLTVWTVGEKTGATIIIDATGGVVPPKPGPDPKPPEPPTPQPDGELGLVKVSRDGLAQVTDPDKRAELAKQQRAHASAVAAGAFSGAPSILAGWRAANNRVEPDLTKLAAWQAKWKPWGAAVSAKLSELYAAGKLPDTATWARAFNEIADGLEAK